MPPMDFSNWDNLYVRWIAQSSYDVRYTRAFRYEFVVRYIAHQCLVRGGANNDLRPSIAARFGHGFHNPLIASHVLHEPLSASYG